MFDNGQESLIIKDKALEKISRSWMKRTFSPMEKDSLRGTIFTLLAASLGTGTYSLHHCFDEIGIFWGVLLLLVGFTTVVLGFDIYTHASKRLGNPKSFVDIHKGSVGPGFNLFTTFITLVYLFLICLSYTVCISKLMYIVFYTKVWDYLNISEENRDFMVFHGYSSYLIGFCCFLLIVPKTIDRLASFSIFAFATNVYVVILIMFQSPSYFFHLVDLGQNEFNFFSLTFKDFFYNFGLVICSFNNLPNFIIVRDMVKNPTRRRMRKIYVRNNIIVTTIYFLGALLSYLSLGIANAKATDLILFRPQIGQSDMLMSMAQIFFIVSMIIALAFMSFPLKMTIMNLLGEPSGRKNFIVSFAICLCFCSIGSHFDNVSAYITLTGAICGTCMLIIFPMVIALNTKYYKTKAAQIGLWAWLIIGGTSGIISTYFCLMNFF